MRFYDYLEQIHPNASVDEEHYMMEMWNAAIENLLQEMAQHLDDPDLARHLESFKQDKDVF